jgi:glycosyltransferase involved in cell wall biosynthesis
MLVSGEYPPDPGGVGDYTHLLGRALIARGHGVMVVTSDQRPTTNDQRLMTGAQRPTKADSLSEEPQRVTISGNWSWRSIRPLLKTVATIRPEIVHIQYQTGAYGMRPAINLLPRLLRRLHPRTRIVVTMHDLRLPYLLPKAGPLRYFVTRRLIEDVDLVVVTNAGDRQRLAGRGRPDPELFLAGEPLQTRLIPIGSNIEPQPPAGWRRAAWRQTNGIGADETAIAFFGLASPSKGLLDLVAALSALPRPFRLLVIGGEARSNADQAYLAQVRAAIDRLELGERIYFTGYCDPRTVSAHLLAADIGALPFHDGASYRRGSLLAMLAHGLPLVTTRPEAPLEPPLVDGEDALLVEPGAPAQIAEAIERLARDTQLQKWLSENGRSLADHFTWPAIAAAHEDVYNDLLG